MKNFTSFTAKLIFTIGLFSFENYSTAQVIVDANTSTNVTGSTADDNLAVTLTGSIISFIEAINNVTATNNAVQSGPTEATSDLSAYNNIAISLGNGTDGITFSGIQDLSGNTLSIDNTTENVINNATLSGDQNFNLNINGDYSGTGSISLPGANLILGGISTNDITQNGTLSADEVYISAVDFTNSSTINGTSSVLISLTNSSNISSSVTSAGTLDLTAASLTITGTVTTTAGGTIGIVTDQINGTNLTGSGYAFIKSRTNTTTIGIGNGATGTLNIDNTEIANITDGFSLFQFGQVNGSGAMDIQTVTFTDPITFETGSGMITLNGNITSTSNPIIFDGPVTLGTDLTITGSDLTYNDNDLVLGTSILTSNANLSLNTEAMSSTVNGLAVGNYGSINVNGTVNLTNSTYTINGSYTGSGGDQIVLIDNDGVDAVTGTFTGLAEGSVVGNGFTISYAGGDGNDVVLVGIATPDIDLEGNGVAISNNDLTPATGDFTDFGNVNLGINSTNSFDILNNGSAILNLIGFPNRVVISGTNASDFSVTSQPAATVGIAGSESFDIMFTPSGSGLRSAQVLIYSDDSNDPTYTFAIQGTGQTTEIDVRGNGISIADNDNTPDASDHTDFGNSVLTGSIVRTFTISNTSGGPDLTLSGITITGIHAGDFVVTSSPTSPISGPSGFTTFDITFTPSGFGLRFAEVHISNNDSDENPYDFAILGNGITEKEIQVTGGGLEIVNGDVSPSLTDDTDFGSVAEASGSSAHVFTINNTGEDNLTITGVSVSGTDFSISGLGGTPFVINGNSSQTFTLTFDPTIVGTITETVTINSDDADEAVYTFDVIGIGNTSGEFTMGENGTSPQTITNCSGTLFDSGGASGQHQNNEDYVYTISPNDVNVVTIEFSSFDVESHVICNYDYLIVNYGSTTIKYCNQNPPALNTPLSGDPGSPIILTWHSDNGVTKAGFEINWTSSINATVNSTDVTCFGDNDGTISISPSGSNDGVSPWTYKLDGTLQGSGNLTGVLPGSHTVEMIDVNQCSYTQTLSILEPATLNIVENIALESCAGAGDGQITLSGLGGTTPYNYTVDAVGPQTSGVFNGYGVGTYTTNISDANGCTDAGSVTFTTPVNGGPTGTGVVTGPDFYCGGSTDPQAYSVSGVVGATHYIWEFDTLRNPNVKFPTITTAGNSTNEVFNFVTAADSMLLYVIPVNGCGNGDTIFFQIDSSHFSPTQVNFAMAPAIVDASVTSVDLLPTVDVGGGTFSGTGVAGNTFYPVISGLGAHSITYDIYDSNGCPHSYTDDIIVIDNAGAITVANTICGDGANSPLIATIDPTLTVASIQGWTIDGSSTGVNDPTVNDSIAEVIPSALSHGIHDVRFDFETSQVVQTGVTPRYCTINIPLIGNYTYICGFDPVFGTINVPLAITESFYIDSIGTINLLVTQPSACESQTTPVQFFAQFNHPQGTSNWTSNAPAGFNVTTQTSSELIPLDATVGTYNVQYDYISTFQNSGCAASANANVTVLSQPTSNFSLAPYFSVDDPGFNTMPNPVGGNYENTGAAGMAGDFFYPGIIGPGNYDIEYIVANASGCTDTLTLSTQVIDNTGSISGLDTAYCYGHGVVNLIGDPNGGGIGGLATGTGGWSISSSSDDSNAVLADPFNPDLATFDPDLAGPGLHTITYTWTDQVSFSVSQDVLVDSIGLVSFTGLNANNSYCVDDAQFSINEVVNHVGGSGSGSFSYTGPGGSFFPAGGSALITPQDIGNWDITYTYDSDLSGCFADSTETITIYGLPSPSFELDSIYNFNGSFQPLVSSPSGGTFVGIGMLDTVFYPNLANIGSNTITYQYTDPITGCYYDTTQTTLVETAGRTIEDLESFYCYYDNIDQFWADNINNSDVGEFTISTNTGLVDLMNDNATINPSQIGEGSHLITYTYMNVDTFTVTQAFIIDSVAKPQYVNFDPEYCIDDPISFITVTNLYPSNGSYTWSGPATGFVGGTSSASYDPSTVGTNTNHEIKFIYTSPLGCKDSIVDFNLVHELPVVDFTMGVDYCSNEPDTTVVGNQTGGLFFGQINDVWNNPDSVQLSPRNTPIGTHSITYEYTDPVTTCFNSISKDVIIHDIPNVSIDVLAPAYCEQTGVWPLVGQVDLAPINDGFFIGPGIIDPLLNDGQADFDPDFAGVGGSYDVTYSYTDLNGCTNTVTNSTVVNPLPVVTISGIDPGKQYCDNDNDPVGDALTWAGSPQIANGISGNFILDGTNLSTDIVVFDPFVYAGGDQDTIPLSYTYTDNNGCINTFEDTVYVNPSAIPEIAVSDQCIVDPVTFFDVSDTTTDGFASWHWEIEDTTYNQQNPVHLVSVEGAKLIEFKVTTNSGCVSYLDTTITFGNAPTANFDWENTCFDINDPVNFTDLTSSNWGNNILSYEWNFGDGIGFDLAPTNHDDTLYQYNAAGDYLVEQIVTTQFGCSDTLKQLISVKPIISVFPYEERFTNGPGSWTTETIIQFDNVNNWELGAPNGLVINDSTNQAWVTNVTNPYDSDQRSYVIGPCFDLSVMEKPMIKFNIWRDLLDVDDGAVLEYSIDNGITWKVLGFDQGNSDGINWYNSNIINGGNGPGGDVISGGQNFGWTNSSDAGWVECRHDLDALIGQTQVVFRFAFSSNSTNAGDGFAFDNIWIGERTKYVLSEHFTNTSSASSASYNPNYNAFVTQYQNDIIDIQYHVNTLSNDLLYSDYPAGPNARSLYYGVIESATTITDGNVLNNATGLWTSDSLVTLRRSLLEADFGLDLTKTINGNMLDVNLDVTSYYNHNDTVDVQIVLIEKQIDATDINSSGGIVLNGEVSFNNVVKHMLPDAGGTRIDDAWTSNQIKSISESIDLSSLNFYGFGADDLEVIAFVQNSSTKEIYQTASTDTSYVPIVLSEEEAELSDLDFSFSLYPNPTQGNIFVMFNQAIRGSAELKIFNELGQTIDTKQITNGVGYNFDMANYANGIYFVNIIHDGKVYNKRFILRK